MSTVAFELVEPDLAVITFCDPDKGANVLSRAVLEEFAAALERAERTPGLAGLVIRSTKPGVFIAGADIREFAAATSPTRDEIIALATRGRELFARLSRVPFVTVAAIEGVCLGGGAELAIGCDRRLLGDGPKTQFGFPEVKLGLFPGWGGTVRTPRIVGLSNAVELVCGGEPIEARTAVAMGLATDVAPAAQLLDAARALVRVERQTGRYLDDRRRWSAPIEIGETELMFLGATASAYIHQQTKGHYPAPAAALELMLETALVDADTAGRREAEGFAELFGTPINRALINVFLLTDRNKKDPGIEGRGAAPRAIASVGVVGAGIMGAGIAAASVKRELRVVLADAAPAALARGVRGALEEAAYDRAVKGPSVERLLKLTPHLQPAAGDADFAGCDLVIEAVVEKLEVKREVLPRLERQLRPDALLASNTSAISIGQLAKSLERPEQFCGIHFFNPVRKMPLVEVIRGPRTSDATVAAAVAYAKSLGKSPIVVQDGPGFLVNRLLLPYMNEALELVLDGLELDQVDRAAREFGMPMGPITLYDVVGLDTALGAGRVMQAAFPERIVESPLLAALVAAGRLGQKSGAGFFRYAGKPDRGQRDPALAGFIEPLRQAARPVAALPPPDRDALIHRLFLPMVVEATRILDERIVRDPRDVDLGLIFGIGFPPFRGGLLYWADTLGAARIVELLRPLEPLGARFRPTDRLLDMARRGAKFYDPAGGPPP